MRAEGQSLSQQAGRSALWQLAGGGWTTIVRLGASFFLARALTPSDYGVFGMAILMREFVQHFGSLAMGAGLIAKKELTDEDLCTCFWSMAAIRFFMFLLAFLLAPVCGLFFHDPRVTGVVRIISITFLFSAIGVISGTLLKKELRFNTLNKINGCIIVLESFIAVILALKTNFGYWALVIGALLYSFLYNLIVLISVNWYPKFKFSKKSFDYLFMFGINGLGFNITNYLKQNLDYLIVGRFLGTASLGLYEFAYRMPHLIQERISRPVGAVVFPALSKVQHDNQKLADGYIQTIKYVSMISFPLLFGLAAVAHVAVPLLWGEQWIPIVTPLRLLCICAALRIVPQPVGSIFYCKKRPDIQFKISACVLIWTFIVVGTLGYAWGINGVAVGMILSVIPEYISLFIAYRMLQEKLGALFKSIFPVIISSFFCSSAAYFVSIWLLDENISLFSVCSISILIGSLIYILSFFILFKQVLFDSIRKVEIIIGKKIY